MDDIRDCLGRLACKGDARTGRIENLFKGQKSHVILPIGGCYTIERDSVVTIVTRTDKDNRRSVFQSRYPLRPRNCGI